MQDIPDFRHFESLVDRRRRLRNVLISVPASVAVLVLLSVWLLGEKFFFYYLQIPTAPFVLAALVLLAVSALSLLMAYLQTGFSFNRSQEVMELARRATSATLEESHSATSQGNDALATQVEGLRSEVSRLSEDILGIDENRRLKLVELVADQVRHAAIEELWQELQKKVEAETLSNSKYRDISEQFKDARTRLAQEVSSLGRRGNLNLSLGVITTVVGLALLGYFVLFRSGDPSNQLVDFAIHFIPRLTLVIFIEVFAYFFLRLYKSTLSEIKYFQNEVTNIEAKYIALKTALNIGDQKIIGEVVAQFGNTERNHVLEKGQTTVEIERSRIDKEGLSEAVKNLSAIFSKRL
jgi:hypothetical protein